MSETPPFPLSRIVIVGDTLAGWMSAAMLSRMLGGAAKIALCPERAQPTIAGALASLPSLGEFHGFLGVDERDLVRFCRATFRLGTLWRDWPHAGADFVDDFGETGAPVDGVAFHHAWTRARRAGASSAYDRFSLGARAGRLGRFQHPSTDPRDIRASYRYGLHLDAQLYADYMRRYAIHYGVETTAPLADVEIAAGRIGALTAKDGARLAADLYLDCSGPAAILLDRLDSGGWRDFSGAPALDRIAWRMADGAAALSLTDYRAGDIGWRSVAPLQDSRCETQAFASSATDDETARAAFGAGNGAVEFAPIRRRRRAPWAGNVVAVGDAACELDPLASPSLRIAEAGLTTLRGLLPATHGDCGERDEYNRIMENAFERLHDFQTLHYARSPAAWAAGAAPSPHLLRKIEQFESRGRLVQYDEESVAPENWISCLLGHGVIPGRSDPLLDPAPDDMVKAKLDAMMRAVDDAAKAMPDQLDYLTRAGAVKPERRR